MASFYNAIRGTTAGTPGTGAFTPNAAASGCFPWSDVATGWFGTVLFEDGSARELSFCYWNGTTLSRSTSQFLKSTTGSILSLTSSATAAMIVGAWDVQPHVASLSLRHIAPQIGGSSLLAVGMPAATGVGTAAAVSMATTTFLTEQPRIQYTGTTSANSQAGVYYTNALAIVSTTAGRGGIEYTGRCGATTLPTGPRLVWGASRVTQGAVTTDPSAATNILMFGKDSADTNIQFMYGGATVTKVDTGIPLAQDAWYEWRVRMEPGGGSASGLLVRMDTGDIWHSKVTSGLPTTGTMTAACLMSNAATTGVTPVFQFGHLSIRTGG